VIKSEVVGRLPPGHARYSSVSGPVGHQILIEDIPRADNLTFSHPGDSGSLVFQATRDGKIRGAGLAHTVIDVMESTAIASPESLSGPPR